MRRLADGSSPRVLDVDEHGIVRFDRRREAFDRAQVKALGRGLSDEDKEKARRAARGLTDAADALVDAINGVGRWLVKVPTPVLVAGALWWLGPSLLGGAAGGVAARRSSGRRTNRSSKRGRRGR